MISWPQRRYQTRGKLNSRWTTTETLDTNRISVRVAQRLRLRRSTSGNYMGHAHGVGRVVFPDIEKDELELVV